MIKVNQQTAAEVELSRWGHMRSRSRTGPLATLVFMLLSGVLHAQVSATKLSVSATGFKSTRGHAIVAVYASKDPWLHAETALRLQTVKITGVTIRVDFADLTPGTYGVSVIHDENDNGKLDMRWLPIPSSPW